MIEQFLSGMKGDVMGELTKKIGIPSDKIDDLLKVTGQVTATEVAKEATGGGLANVMNLFSSSSNNSSANSLQDNIASGIVAGFIQKLGLDESKAKMAAGFIVPLVMSKITGKNSETPDDDPSPIASLFGLGGGKSDDGIMGTLGKFF